MVKLSKKQVNEIAQYLGSGATCYVNKVDGEFRSVIDWDRQSSYEEFWSKEIAKIEEEWSDYLVLDKIPAHITFGIMEEFAASIENQEIRNRLFHALSKSKPFRKFKDEVDYVEDIRQRWFAFKQEAYEAYVRNKLAGYFLFE